jgi:hypothetical protein
LYRLKIAIGNGFGKGNRGLSFLGFEGAGHFPFLRESHSSLHFSRRYLALQQDESEYDSRKAFHKRNGKSKRKKRVKSLKIEFWLSIILSDPARRNDFRRNLAGCKRETKRGLSGPFGSGMSP